MGGVFEQVVILVLMIAAGFIAAKANVITGEGRSLLTKIVLNISSPMVVISSFQMRYSPEMMKNLGIVVIFAVVSIPLSYLLGKGIWRIGDGDKRRVLLQATMFTNCGFMGYPVLQSIFGNTGVMYGSVYVMAFTVFTWTLGIYIYAGKMGSWKEIVLQPGLIAVAAGLLLFVLGIQLPPWLGKTVSGLGSLNTPLAMLIIGALVAEGDFRNGFREWTIFAASAVRLLILPALALGALWLVWRLGMPGMPAVATPVISTCVLLTGMPVAANVAIFASMYSIKPQYAAQNVLVSTLLSVATVPLWIFVLHFFIGK